MKSFQKAAVFAAALFSVLGCAPAGPDSVRQAKQVNAASPIGTSRQASVFLVEMVDARLMDYAEGELIASRSKRAAVKKYGETMLRDQPKMLASLRELAKTRSVAVPEVVGAKKRNHYNSLYLKAGDELDEAVITSLRRDHERDVEQFREATKFDDKGLADFATKTLPLIEQHLQDARALEEQL